MAWPWNKQGIASPNLNVPQNQQQYFSGDNPGAYGSGDWRSNMNQSYNWGNTNQPTMDYNYQDLIMNPEDNPNALQNLERFADNRFTGDTQKNMRLAGEPWIAENWTPKDIINTDTTLTGYQKFPRGDQWNNKDKYLKSDQYLDTLEPSLSGQNFDKKGFKFPGIMGGILDSLKDQFQYKGATETLWDPKTGQMITAEEQDKQNALGGYYSEAAKNARRNRKSVLRMLKRRDEGQGYGKNRLQKLIDLGYGPTDQGGGDTGPKTQSYTQGAAQGTKGSWTPGGTYQGGGYQQKEGSHHFNQGGRAGYRFGEEVAQETDLIEGPQGTNEFQETVVEGQEQPSREQLEALAMEIFQLPLEELDEQQLLVVYQEAMQGQPMEEAVQEEDVQFAAQGGLAGLL